MSTVNGAAYTYDANGNLLTGAGRSFSWNADNQPASITGSDGVTETYAYDAAGSRVSRTRSGVTTVYLGGMVEEDVSPSATRTVYEFDGQVIAQRDANGAVYLHSDHLGSVSVVTSSGGGLPIASGAASSEETRGWRHQMVAHGLG